MRGTVVHVVAGVLERAGEYLLSRRQAGTHLAGLWEFPGGKVDAGESPVSALRRELAEELGIQVHRAFPLIGVPFHYPDKSIYLDVWRVTEFTGEPRGMEGQALRWLPAANLDAAALPEADRPVVTALSLPGEYVITPTVAGASSWMWEGFERLALRGWRLVQWRQPEDDRGAWDALAAEAVHRARDLGLTLLLNCAPERAQALGAAGVHLNSSRLMRLDARPEVPGLIAASCHNPVEVQRAVELGLDFAVLSPIGPTASHPELRAWLGWEGFAHVARSAAIPLFALGGVGPGQRCIATYFGAQGVAGISAFWSMV